MQLSEPSSSSVRSFTELFNTLLQRYGLKVQINPPSFSLNSPAAIDVEHDEQGNLVGIGVYDGRTALFFTRITESLSASLRSCNFVAHNGKGDFECLRAWGIPVSDTQLMWDTMLVGHILDSSQKDYSLKGMAKRELGIEYPEYEDIVGKHKGKTKNAPKCPQTEPGCCGRVTLDRWPVEIVAAYNAMDVYATWKLYERQKNSL